MELLSRNYKRASSCGTNERQKVLWHEKVLREQAKMEVQQYLQLDIWKPICLFPSESDPMKLTEILVSLFYTIGQSVIERVSTSYM